MGRKAAGKTLADADNAVCILWEETRRDSSYKKKCEHWKKLRKDKKDKDAEAAYLEIAAEHDFPPMNPDLSLEDNLKEQIEANELEISVEFAGGKINIEEEYEYSSGETEQFLKYRVWDDLFFRVKGYSKTSLLAYAPAQKLRRIKLVKPGKIIEAKTMRVDLNLAYPTEMVLKKLSSLIEKCTGLKEVGNATMGDLEGEKHHLREFRMKGKAKVLHREESENGIIIESRQNKSVFEGGETDVCIRPNSRLRLDKYDQSLNFAESDLKGYVAMAFLKANEILGVRWDGGEFDLIRKKKNRATRTEWITALNSMLKKRFPQRVYEKFKNGEALSRKLSGELQAILAKAVKLPLLDMNPEELERLNRRVLELAFPQNIKKKHPGYLSRHDCNNV